MTDIIITRLCKSYAAHPVLREFSLRLPAGETTCLMGASGCGKTTLLRILAGLETPDGGTVTGLPEQITMLFQEDRLCAEFSAVTNLRLVAGKKLPREVLETHLREVGLSAEAMRQPVSTLSGGMKRRVALARAVCAGGELLLLDEPFKGLDEETRRQVIAYWKKHTAGKTVLCVTHDRREAEALGGACVEMTP